jgi:hypothetical protein
LVRVLGGVVLMRTGGPDVDGQDALCDELLGVLPRVPDERDRRQNRMSIIRTKVVTDLQRGDVQASRAQAAEVLDVYPAGHEPASFVAMWKGMHEHLAGRFDAAEAANGELVTYVERDVNFANSWAAQLFRIRRDQGRTPELLPIIESAVAQTPGLIALRAVHAVALVDAGEPTQARQILDALAPDGFAAVPVDSVLSSALADLSEVCAVVGDATQAAALHARLVPFTGQLLVVSWGVACLGAADRHLGMLETVMGRLDDAHEHFARAVELERRAEGRSALARTQLWWGELLLPRGGEDAERGRALLRDAADLARTIGMTAVAARAEATLTEA